MVRIRSNDFGQLVDQKSEQLTKVNYKSKTCNFVQSFVICFFCDVIGYAEIKMALWMNVTCSSSNNAFFPKSKFEILNLALECFEYNLTLNFEHESWILNMNLELTTMSDLGFKPNKQWTIVMNKLIKRFN